jgi:hypothetical protein
MKTGELYMQFDNDKPIKVQDIFDYEKVSFVLSQSDPKEKFKNDATSLSFNSKDKKFKLYIKEYKNEQ